MLVNSSKYLLIKVLEVKKKGLFGDGQADLQAHGGVNKAIYLYSYLHYEYWSSILKKDFSEELILKYASGYTGDMIN